MPELVFFRRGEEVMRLPLGADRVILGRGEKSDVVLPDPAVSRQHVALSWDGVHVLFEDLSGKGTLIAGRPLREGVLEDGQDISLGQWRAVFRERAVNEGDDQTEVGGTRTEQQPKGTPLRVGPVQVRLRHGANEQVHRLQAETFTVGSDPEANDLCVTDRFVSSRHLQVSRSDSGFIISDQHSTNGTFIGPLRVYQAEVPLGATVRIGETELHFEPAVARKEGTSFEGLIGNDPSIRALADLIERVAPSSAAVAVFGESGTGKELVAHAIHNRSPRASAPFIPVNCAAISKELIESELFGHEKGAFTGAQGARKGAFEEADGGTLFLDEIGELPLDMQAKFLRALESGEIKRVGSARPVNVDVRVVAATNKDLLAAARAGEFREDLYYRLCVIPLHLPPLRSRRGDLMAIAEHFVRQFSPRGQTVKLTPGAVERLGTHHWPGNVRELRNVVHRALLLRKGPMIEATDLSFDSELNAETGIPVQDLPPGMTLEQMLERLERQIIESALRRYNNNRERVAKELGVARSTLFKRLKQWGLTGVEDEG